MVKEASGTKSSIRLLFCFLVGAGAYAERECGGSGSGVGVCAGGAQQKCSHPATKKTRTCQKGISSAEIGWYLLFVCSQSCKDRPWEFRLLYLEVAVHPKHGYFRELKFAGRRYR